VLGRAGELGGAGMVVVLHDGGGNRANTAAALPGIIDGLSAAGYTFVSLC
jgi:peptidoglycan-N-acetylglucosamine deacetylase